MNGNDPLMPKADNNEQNCFLKLVEKVIIYMSETELTEFSVCLTCHVVSVTCPGLSRSSDWRLAAGSCLC